MSTFEVTLINYEFVRFCITLKFPAYKFSYTTTLFTAETGERLFVYTLPEILPESWLVLKLEHKTRFPVTFYAFNVIFGAVNTGWSYVKFLSIMFAILLLLK